MAVTSFQARNPRGGGSVPGTGKPPRAPTPGGKPGNIPKGRAGAKPRPPAKSPGSKRPGHSSGRTTNHPAKTQAPHKQVAPTPLWDVWEVVAGPGAGTPAPIPSHHLAGGPKHPMGGFSFATDAAITGHPLGHHPASTGRGGIAALTHSAASRRSRIISYDSGTNTAIVQFGDTPDSPTLSIPVSPAITSTEIAGATMAGVTLWDDTDPYDMLIEAVL